MRCAPDLQPSRRGALAGDRDGDAGADDPRLAPALRWFAASGRRPFPFQLEAWRAWLDGESGLVNAATGSGKTLAAWLGPVLEDLSSSLTTPPARPPGLRLLWITPLRALANDLVANLREPLRALGSPWRVEARTGDTASSARARQRARPPEALVTTPESLSVMLSFAEAQATLAGLDGVVVDEWHELLGAKRGVQLELGLARLRQLNPRLRTWGISATLPDLEVAQRALLGPGRTGRIVRSDQVRILEIESVIPPTLQRFPWAGHLGLQLLPEVVRAIGAARTTLLFTNTRSQAETWYQALLRARPDWLTELGLHHGSIDRKVREKVEDGLRRGSLRAVICTASLDLGVDFSPVEQVIQVGSPKGIARLMQRAGRSGHRPGETSRILCVPTHAWELLEIAAVRRAVADGRLEPRLPLTRSLDVLVQHCVTLAAGGGFDEDALLHEVRSTHAFASLRDAEWQWVIDFITRGGSALQAYPQFRRVVRDRGLLRIASADHARRHRIAIGTITSDASMILKWLGGGELGTIEESFVSRLKPRQAFVFAGRVVELVQVKDMTAYVRLASKSSRHVPRWQGTRLPLSVALGEAVLRVLESAGEPAPQPGRPLPEPEPELVAMRPLLAIQADWSALPRPGRLLVETITSREGFHLFVFPFAGRLVNEGLATLVAARWARDAPRTFSVAANEYGFELLGPEPLPVDEPTLRRLLAPAALLDDLLAAINVSELARRQFRGIARIAGLVDVGPPRRGKSTRQLQASTALVYDVLRQYDAGSLLLAQAEREVLESQLELAPLRAALERAAASELLLRQPRRLTPLSFPLWAERLQTQTVSTETWQQRVERAAARLEAQADG
jgi:ATP-dependent Lhr-like helicase